VEDPFQQALNLGGGDSDDSWFSRLWGGKILKATFFEPDLKMAAALALKKQGASIAK
jgi:hypothetical protein